MGVVEQELRNMTRQNTEAILTISYPYQGGTIARVYGASRRQAMPPQA
jgi:hypothetical protein